MSKSREAFEKWLGESPTYTECGARYVNHVINEQWKAWKHQQACIDELVSSRDAEFRLRTEDGWALASVGGLVRRLDVALNGEEGEAMLCDIVAQVESGKYPALEAVAASQIAFDELFGHCLSNGVFNAWQKPMDCTKLNAAIHLTGKVMRRVKP